MSASAGRNRTSSCSPASVGATLRVVRESSRTPSVSSSPRIAWLMADGETPKPFGGLCETPLLGYGEKGGQDVEIARWHS